MTKQYRVTKEQDGWAVSTKKTGQILAMFDHRHQADEHMAAQVRADEQSNVLASFNDLQEVRSLLGELREELS